VEIPDNDHVIRAVGLGGRARAVVAATTSSVEELRRLHDPSPEVAAAIGRLATGALLLASTLEKITRREPLLTVEVDGGGPAGRLIATASPAGWVRAMVANPLATSDQRADGKLDVSGVVGAEGQLVVTRDPGIGEPYRGVVNLVSGELAKDLAFYLSESEQSPAAVVLGVKCLREGRIANAGGLLVQLLPGVSDREALELTDRIRSLGAVSSRLADGKGPRQWLAEIFPEGCSIFGEVPARFFCGCSMERVERALKLLGADEIRAVLEEGGHGGSDVICGFCRMAYTLHPARLRELIAEVESERARFNCQDRDEIGMRN
jgi:molecular chaperone Hsp33